MFIFTSSVLTLGRQDLYGSYVCLQRPFKVKLLGRFEGSITHCPWELLPPVKDGKDHVLTNRVTTRKKSTTPLPKPHLLKLTE